LLLLAQRLSSLDAACPSAGRFGNWSLGVIDVTISLILERKGFFRWWRDEPSGNEVRKTLGYFIEVYLPWLPLLSGLVLPTPSGLRPGLALGGWLPIGWAIGCVGFELPTLFGLGVWALAVRADLALLLS
jgi:hypothetical protein